eukprot:6769281-Prymnesium_polylepis.1
MLARQLTDEPDGSGHLTFARITRPDEYAKAIDRPRLYELSAAVRISGHSNECQRCVLPLLVNSVSALQQLEKEDVAIMLEERMPCARAVAHAEQQHDRLASNLTPLTTRQVDKQFHASRLNEQLPIVLRAGRRGHVAERARHHQKCRHRVVARMRVAVLGMVDEWCEPARLDDGLRVRFVVRD